MEWNKINDLYEENDNCFYLYHSDRFKSNLNNIYDAFSSYFSSVVVGYSFKTNYLPALIKDAKSLGCRAEVVSKMEYDIAKALGFSGNEIIFNGPIKKYQDFVLALKDKSIINIDSLYELEYLERYRNENPKGAIEIGLRINIDLKTEDGISKVQCGLRSSRFGLNKELLIFVKDFCQKHSISIVSIHGHTSSMDRAVGNYKIISHQLLEVCEELDLTELKFFDLGGGFFGASPEGLDISDRPTYTDYAKSVAEVLLNNDWFIKINPTVVIEPGASVSSNVMEFCTRIYQIKVFGDKKFLCVDGSIYNVKPTLYSGNPFYKLVSQNRKKKEYVDLYDVVGSTCMEKDVILSSAEFNEPESGDFICFRGLGAYCIVLTPNFINYLPPIYKIENNNISSIRRQQSCDDVLNIYIVK